MVTDSLQAFWDFNNSLTDSVSGKVLIPQTTSGIAYQSEGVKLTNTFLHYDGFPFNSSGYTIVVQVYNLSMSTSSNCDGIITTGIGPNSGIGSRVNGVSLYSGNIIAAFNGVGDGATRSVPMTKLLVNKWNTITFRYDGVTTDSFLNDIKITSAPGNAILSPNLYIAAMIGTPMYAAGLSSGYANGTYKNLAIYSRPLSDNEIFNYNTAKQLADINNVQFADKIPCIYSAGNNTFGGFAGFGLSSDDLSSIPDIPYTSSATPYGKFNWIYVGKDYLGRKKFIADRYVQINISWDVLNAGGMCSEKQIDLGFGDKTKTYIRLLTGGISPTDTDNEWDKIIVCSNLGGNITAGDDNVWHWNVAVANWTTTSVSNNTARVYRGYSGLSYWNANTTSTVANMGFRPVLLIEQPLSLIKLENPKLNIINNNFDVNITSDGITHEDNKPIKYKVSIIKPDNSVVIKHDYDTDYSETPFNFPTVSFNQNEFDNGNNTIVIDVTDINGNINTWTFNIIRTSLNKILIIDGNNLKYVLNNNLTLLDSDYVDLDENKLVNYLMINGSDNDIKINNLKAQCENIDNLKVLIFNTNVLNNK